MTVKPHLVVTQQNILAKSLGSNTIPWCLTLSSSLHTQADSALASYYSDINHHDCEPGLAPKNWKEWKKYKLAAQYLKSFHKNFDSGDYTKMRSFWGTRQCKSSKDIPYPLSSHLRFEKEDCISYETEIYVPIDPAMREIDGTSENRKEKKRVMALTLRGVLFAEPAFTVSSGPSSTSLALQLFEEIVSLEENVFDWSVRGPRIFQSLLFPPPPLSLPMFTSTDCKEKYPLPDIVALQEYDIHSSKACYRQQDVLSQTHEETFSEAMRREGYSGIFFSDPLLTRKPPSGIAIYFKHDRFELCDAFGFPLTFQELSNNLDENHFIETCKAVNCHEQDIPWTISLSCGKTIDHLNSKSHTDTNPTTTGPAAVNIDMMERWTPFRRIQRTYNSENEELQLLKLSSRRNAGFIRLRERHEPNRILHVLTVHLMTTSRDGPKSNKYPGEIRARELEVLKDLVKHHVIDSTVAPSSIPCAQPIRTNNKDEVTSTMKPVCVLLGDFNTAPDELDVFSGKIKPCASHNNPSSAPRIISTGFCKDDVSFKWADVHGNEVKLVDAFAKVHENKKVKHCTSRNADRSSWIDYIYHTEDTLRVAKDGLSDTRVPETNIPNETYGSDHLGLTVGFEWN